ncbi:unnamed protein product [Trichobilharzia szidati]|nr:unnamed protein product [Trichobilharzia szidati]
MATSACSTPSTSPGLGHYEDNYRIKSKVKNQKLTIKIKKEPSVPTKVKKSKHTKSISSDAIGDNNNNNNHSTPMKSPRPSSIGSGGGGGVSSRGRGGVRGGRGGGGASAATTGSSRKGRPKLSTKLEQEDKEQQQQEGHDEQRQPQPPQQPKQEQKPEPVVSFPPPQSKCESPANTTPTTTTTNTTGLYCLCKTPYDQSREYIGCDLCRDWFHFECVGLDPKDAHKLGDSWHCPDCKQAELKANEMLYCVCRTPYEPTRVYIACDGCDEWYHPECVGLTPEEAVNHEDTYLCPTCRESAQSTTSADAAVDTTSTKSSKSGGRTNKSKTASNHDNNNNNDNNGNTLEDTSAIHPVTGAKTIYATHLNTDSIQRLIHLVDEIKKHKMSWPFVTTPDPQKFPIVNTLNAAFNLPNVIINLKTGVYKTLGDFSFDMNRLFTNSRLIYPKDTPEFNCTEIVEALFVQKMKQFKETL